MEQVVQENLATGYYDLLGDFIVNIVKKPIKSTLATAQTKRNLLTKRALKTKEVLLKFLQLQMGLPLLDQLEEENTLPLIPVHLLGEGYVIKYAPEYYRKSQMGLYPEQNLWYDHNIMSAHESFLIYSMKILTCPGESEMIIEDKLDVLSWIFAGETILYKGQWIRSECAPFSFKACCMLAGLDHTFLQEFVYNKMPVEVQEILWDAAAA